MPELNLHLHLVSGRVGKFRQTEPEPIARILQSLQPNRVFAQRQITVADRLSISLFPTSSVTYIEAFGDQSVELPRTAEMPEIEQITAAQLRERYDPEDTGPASAEATTVFAEISLVNGKTFDLEVHLHPSLQIDRRHLMGQMLSQPCFSFRRLEQGVVLVNSAHIMNLSVSPGPRQMPANAWLASYAS